MVAQNLNDTVPSEEEIKDFIQRYVNEYRRFLNESYPKRAKEFPLYSGYPCHVTAYVDKQWTLVEYQLNMSEFMTEVKIVEKIPKYDRRKGFVGTLYANRYLKIIIDQPENIARKNVRTHVMDEIAYEEYQKEEAEYWEKWWEKYILEDISITVKGYVSYIKTAYSVQEKTCSAMKNEICTVVKIVQNQSKIMDAYLKSGCITLLEVVDEVIRDVESSLFLAIHGKYRPAMALLRRCLETVLVALYFDAELKKYDKSSRTYNNLTQKRDKWVEKSYHIKFTGEYGVLDKLIDPDTDYLAGETLRRTTAHYKKSSFREYIRELYRKLSKFVHYGGAVTTDEMLVLEFAEYSEDRFKEWYTRFNQIYEICNLLTIIKFPEVLHLYDAIQEKLPPEDQVPLLTYQQIQAVNQIVGKMPWLG